MKFMKLLSERASLLCRRRSRGITRFFRQNTGESISEVLVASLIISLAMMALITMVMASFRMIKNSEQKMTWYYAENSSYEIAGPGSDDIYIVISGPPTKTNSSGVETVTVKTISSQDATFKGYVLAPIIED